MEKMIEDPEYSDMKAGLVVFGVLQIILGAFCSLSVFFLILSMLLPARGAAPVSPMMIIPGILLYGGMAVWFIWMGLGSVTVKRWARALSLAASWIWLIAGLGSLVVQLLFLPDLVDQIAVSGKFPADVIPVIRYTFNAMLVIVYLFIPGALVLFYGNGHVRETCERRDPEPSWTDRCPVPVLVMVMMFGITAGAILMQGFCRWVVPFFGVILDGMAGAVVCLVCALLSGAIAWGAYRLDMRAWWGAALTIIAWGASVAVTFSRVSLIDFYRKMNYSEEQLRMMKHVASQMESWSIVFVMVWAAAILGYILYVRRFFVRYDGKRGDIPDDPS